MTLLEALDVASRCEATERDSKLLDLAVEPAEITIPVGTFAYSRPRTLTFAPNRVRVFSVRGEVAIQIGENDDIFRTVKITREELEDFMKSIKLSDGHSGAETQNACARPRADVLRAPTLGNEQTISTS